MAIVSTTVTGQWLDGNNVPLTGTVTFTPVEPSDGGGFRVVSPAVSATLSNGRISQALNTASTYIVLEQVNGRNAKEYYIVPFKATHDLTSDVRGVYASGSVAVLSTSLGQPNGIATLDASSKLLTANLPAGGYDSRYLQYSPTRNPVWGLPTVVTHFQSGHTFTGTNFGSVNPNDTSDYVHGSQVFTATTPGNATIYATIDATGQPAVNTTGKMLRLWVRVDNPDKLNNINIRCAPAGGIAANSYFSWDVILAPYYSGQYLTPAGQWVCLSFSFADSYTVGTPARTAITEWRVIVNDNSTTPSSVHFAGIEFYNTSAPKYPNGVVTLCFDDSYAGHYGIARTVLGQYGYQATMFPIIDQVGTPGSMTVNQMRALQDLQGWEVAPHAYTLANHGNFGTMTPAQIQADLTSSISWLAANGFRRGGSYAYPLGIFSGGQDAAVTPYVDVARTIQSTLNNETLPVGNPLRLRGSSGVGGLGGLSVSTSLTNTGGILDGTKAQQGWCILTMHDVSAGASTNINQISQADLQTLVSGIQSRGIAVATMSEVIRSGAFGV